MTLQGDERQSATVDWACGWTLILAGAVTVAGMLYHPSTGGRGMDAIREIADEGGIANAVHAVMLIALGALVFGFSGLTSRLGWRAALPRAAFVAYALGAVAMMGAAVINGFAINKVARAFLATGSQDLDFVRSSIAMLGALSSTWAQVAVGAQAIAFLSWSAALWSRSRAFAMGGLLSAVPTGASALGVLPLSVHGYLFVVVAQAAWTIAIGILLLRDPTTKRASSQRGDPPWSAETA